MTSFTVAPSVDDDTVMTSHVASMQQQQQQFLVTDVAGIVANNISSSSSSRGLKDPQGAGYYVIAVILVYGMSIVLLIASVIRRNRTKVNVDREIVRYLQEFQTVRETSSRDSYRKLKRAIIAKLSRSGKDGPGTHRGLADIVLSASVVAAPNARRSRSVAFDPACQGPLLQTSASTTNCVLYATDVLLQQPSPSILLQLDTDELPFHFHQRQQQRTPTIHTDSSCGSSYVMHDEEFFRCAYCNGDNSGHGLLNAEHAVGQQRRHMANGDADGTASGATLRVQLHQGVDGWQRVVTFE